MEQNPGGFYVIDALNLKQPSKKPFHLEERIKLRRSSRLISASGSSTSPTGTAVPLSSFYPENVFHTTSSNSSFLEAIRSKLAKRHKHIKNVMSANLTKKSILDSDVDKLNKIKEILEKADKNRATILDNQNVDAKESERIRLASATTAIQNWWRLKPAEKVIKEWKKADLSLERAKAVSFEKLIRIVQSKQVIKSATVLISYLKTFSTQVRIHLVSDRIRGVEEPSSSLLSLYMIVAHTAQIMPSMGEDEEAVKMVATALLTKFELWISTILPLNKVFSVPLTVKLLST
ncbi:UNVERIFIED_CONTAM: hypothetical protein HDU68_008708 [Siphonaria sp. JEL0065]|nr:hypothetical protein HDU68_008708 [Siphonaria sp. JEL0065]